MNPKMKKSTLENTQANNTNNQLKQQIWKKITNTKNTLRLSNLENKLHVDEISSSKKTKYDCEVTTIRTGLYTDEHLRPLTRRYIRIRFYDSLWHHFRPVRSVEPVGIRYLLWWSCLPRDRLVVCRCTLLLFYCLVFFRRKSDFDGVVVILRKYPLFDYGQSTKVNLLAKWRFFCFR